MLNFTPDPVDFRERVAQEVKHYADLIQKMSQGTIPAPDAPEWTNHRFQYSLVRALQASRALEEEAKKWGAIKELFREIGRV